MRALDKTALLFEMLLGSDMTNVNRKIDEIRFSDEYVRVSNFMPETSNTQIGQDIKQRFNSLDIFGVLSMQRILEVEQEIKELDRRISNFTTVNPYLANGVENKYKVSKVGDISVEISTEGMKLNEFTTYEGVKASNRKKVLKHKLFNWYIEAKKGIADSIDNSKLMLSRVRRSKIKLRSIQFQHALILIFTIIFAGLVCFMPSIAMPSGNAFDVFVKYRAGTCSTIQQIVITAGLTLSFALTLISKLCCIAIRTYPFHVASKLRKQITHQKNLVARLDDVSYDFEKEVINKSKKPFKVKRAINSLSILNSTSSINSQELFDYVYSEKEYYIEHRKHALSFHNVIFAIAIIIAAAIGIALLFIA